MDYAKFKAEQKRRNKENGNGDGNRLSGLN